MYAEYGAELPRTDDDTSFNEFLGRGSGAQYVHRYFDEKEHVFGAAYSSAECFL